MPTISTGIYGYPIEGATRIAMEEARTFLTANDVPSRVVFCCFSARDLEVYRRVAGELLAADRSPAL